MGEPRSTFPHLELMSVAQLVRAMIFGWDDPSLNSGQHTSFSGRKKYFVKKRSVSQYHALSRAEQP